MAFTMMKGPGSDPGRVGAAGGVGAAVGYAPGASVAGTAVESTTGVGVAVTAGESATGAGVAAAAVGFAAGTGVVGAAVGYATGVAMAGDVDEAGDDRGRDSRFPTILRPQNAAMVTRAATMVARAARRSTDIPTKTLHPVQAFHPRYFDQARSNPVPAVTLDRQTHGVVPPMMACLPQTTSRANVSTAKCRMSATNYRRKRHCVSLKR